MATSNNYRVNQGLFSEHQLNELLESQDQLNELLESQEWAQISDDKLQTTYNNITNLWEREKSRAPERSISQLEEDYIQPIFRELGIPFRIEEHSNDTRRSPDYVFFETEEAARDAVNRHEGRSNFYGNIVAVANVKKWGQALDATGSGESKSSLQNPSYQIHFCLEETPANWAVLTNGKKWRLYYDQTSHRLDSYYEIDLPVLLENGDIEDFKHFYLFFRHEAFVEDAGGDSFLDHIYDEFNPLVWRSVERVQDGIVETHIQLEDWYLICSMYKNRYAVSWEAPIDLGTFLDVESPLEEQPVEVFFEETDNQSNERKRATLEGICNDDRFPEKCAFLAVDYDEYEVTWESEGTHSNNEELTVAVEEYGMRPFETTVLQSLSDELSRSKITEMLGQLSESLNSDSPQTDSEPGDDG